MDGTCPSDFPKLKLANPSPEGAGGGKESLGLGASGLGFDRR